MGWFSTRCQQQWGAVTAHGSEVTRRGNIAGFQSNFMELHDKGRGFAKGNPAPEESGK